MVSAAIVAPAGPSRRERWRPAGWLGGVLAAGWDACAALVLRAKVERLVVRRRDAAGPAGEDASAPVRDLIAIADRRRLAGALFIAVIATTARAETFKFFGSAGAEWQLTPANAASALNPRNIAGLPYSSGSADAVAFLDASPDSRTWKVHLKLRGDAEEGGAQRADIGEGFVQINPKPWLDVTIGRVIEKWGTGYAWNPTAFVSPQKNPADPSDRRSANVGVDMIRTDLFVRGTNVSLYALNHGAVAGRVYRLIGGTDVSLHFRRDGAGIGDDNLRIGTRAAHPIAAIDDVPFECRRELALRLFQDARR